MTDYRIDGLGADAEPLHDLLSSPRALIELIGQQGPRASYATTDSLLLPGELVDALRELPDHYDGHVSGDQPGDLMLWIDGTGYRLLPLTSPNQEGTP